MLSIVPLRKREMMRRPGFCDQEGEGEGEGEEGGEEEVASEIFTRSVHEMHVELLEPCDAGYQNSFVNKEIVRL